MARSSTGFVTALTAGALAAVGFLAYQASASAPADLGKPNADASPSASSSRSPKDKGKDKTEEAGLPAQSGAGERVVYALGADRVWLVGADGKTQRTFEVTPGTVDPTPGKYAVTTRSGAITGTDGVPIEHVVLFASSGGVPVGFSAAVDGSTPSPDASKKTGGIRESRADGTAMWQFATHGQKVVVVP